MGIKPVPGLSLKYTHVAMHDLDTRWVTLNSSCRIFLRARLSRAWESVRLPVRNLGLLLSSELSTHVHQEHQLKDKVDERKGKIVTAIFMAMHFHITAFNGYFWLNHQSVCGSMTPCNTSIFKLFHQFITYVTTSGFPYSKRNGPARASGTHCCSLIPKPYTYQRSNFGTSILK